MVLRAALHMSRASLACTGHVVVILEKVRRYIGWGPGEEIM